MAETRPLPAFERPTEVRFVRDALGTLFAVEIIECNYWDDGLRVPPSPDAADVRIVFLKRGELPRGLPRWLGVCLAPVPDEDEEWMLTLVERLWRHSPTHRGPGESTEAYVRAAFQALCPPHPPCEPGPHARDAVTAFLSGRGGALGQLAEGDRDVFDRMVRVHWATPAALARAVLIERLADEGAHEAVAMIHRLDAAIVEPASEFDVLAREREGLLARLDPLLFFERPGEFDAALREADGWWARYTTAYAAHCRRLAAMAAALPTELLSAITVADLLRSLNSASQPGAPVGQEALDRLEAAVNEVRAITAEPLEVPAPGIVLGRVPAAFAEARLAAAAVLAAVDVHRRRVTR